MLTFAVDLTFAQNQTVTPLPTTSSHCLGIISSHRIYSSPKGHISSLFTIWLTNQNTIVFEPFSNLPCRRMTRRPAHANWPCPCAHNTRAGCASCRRASSSNRRWMPPNSTCFWRLRHGPCTLRMPSSQIGAAWTRCSSLSSATLSPTCLVQHLPLPPHCVRRACRSTYPPPTAPATCLPNPSTPPADAVILHAGGLDSRKDRLVPNNRPSRSKVKAPAYRQL